MSGLPIPGSCLLQLSANTLHILNIEQCQHADGNALCHRIVPQPAKAELTLPFHFVHLWDFQPFSSQSFQAPKGKEEVLLKHQK